MIDASKNTFTIKYRSFPDLYLCIPFDWSVDPYRNNNWSNYIHSLRWFTPMYNGWINSNKEDPCPILLLNDYLSFHYVKDGHFNPYYNSRLADHSLAERLNIYNEIFMHYKVDKEVSKYLDYAKFENEMIYTLDILSSNEIYRIRSNHGFMIDLSIIKFSLSHPEFDKINSYMSIAESRIANQLDAIFDDTGISKEHSISYQEFDCALCIELLNAYKDKGVNSYLTIRLQQIIISSYHFLNFCTDDSEEYPKIGDSFPLPNRKLKNLILTEFNKIPLTVRSFFQCYYNFNEYLGLFLAKQAGFAAIKEKDCDLNIDLFFTAAWHSYVHKQNDDLSFTCSMGGKKIIEDPGYTDISNDTTFRDEEMHNCHYSLEIPWIPRTEIERNTKILGYYRDSRVVAVQGVHERIPGIQVERNLILLDNRFLIVYDTFIAQRRKDKSNLKARFNFGSTINAIKINDNVMLNSSGFTCLISTHPSNCEKEIVNSKIYNRDGSFTDTSSLVVDVIDITSPLITIFDLKYNQKQSCLDIHREDSNAFKINLKDEQIYLKLNQPSNNLFVFNNYIKSGINLYGVNSYASINKLEFSEDTKWNIFCSFKELENQSAFNFFLGERGTPFNSFARVSDKIFYRCNDGSYIGGVPYKTGELCTLLVTYDQGAWVFRNQDNQEIHVYKRVTTIFDSIGSGYYGHSHEENMEFYKLIIELDDIKVCELDFDEGFGCISFDKSASKNHATLKNTSWLYKKTSTAYLSPERNINVNPVTDEFSKSLDIQKIDFLSTLKNADKLNIVHGAVNKFINGFNTVKAEEYIIDGIVTLSRFPTTKISHPITWGENPFSSRSWEWQWHQFAIYPYLISGHAQTKDKKFLSSLEHLVSSWCKLNYTKVHPSKMSWHDHATALRLRSLIHIFEYCRTVSDSSDEFLYLLLSAIESHCNILCYNEFYSKHNNHGFDQSHILLLASVVFPQFEESDNWRTTAELRIADELRVAFSSDGMHVENSPSYLVTMIQRLESLFELVNESRINLNINLELLINNSLQALAYLLTPQSKLPMLGDTDNGTRITEFKSLNKLKNYDLFEYSMSKGKRGKIDNHLHNLILPESGYAVFRDKWHDSVSFHDTTHLVFKCGFLSTYHRHDDDLNFTLFAKGEEWIVDGGIFSYDENSTERKYIRSVFSHNIPTVYNTRIQRALKQEILESTGICGYDLNTSNPWVEASSNMHDGYVFTRRITQLAPCKFYFEDSVVNKHENCTCFSILFHTPSDKQVTIIHNKITIQSNSGHTLSINFLEDADLTINLIEPNDMHLSVNSPSFGMLSKTKSIEVIVNNVGNGENVKFEIEI